MLPSIEEYKKCIQRSAFFDAHEALEAIWFPRRFENRDDVKLLKGFINAAVSFELHKRSRERQSAKVWANYLKYRQLLFKIDSSHKNSLYQLSRFVEEVHNSLKSH